MVAETPLPPAPKGHLAWSPTHLPSKISDGNGIPAFYCSFQNIRTRNLTFKKMAVILGSHRIHLNSCFAMPIIQPFPPLAPPFFCGLVSALQLVPKLCC